MQNYNPEQIMLSAVSHRTSRDVNIMKEKLILSGAALSAFTPANKNSLACNWTDEACVYKIQVEILQYVLKRQVCPILPNTLRLQFWVPRRGLPYHIFQENSGVILNVLECNSKHG